MGSDVAGGTDSPPTPAGGSSTTDASSRTTTMGSSSSVGGGSLSGSSHTLSGGGGGWRTTDLGRTVPTAGQERQRSRTATVPERIGSGPANVYHRKTRDLFVVLRPAPTVSGPNPGLSAMKAFKNRPLKKTRIPANVIRGYPRSSNRVAN